MGSAGEGWGPRDQLQLAREVEVEGYQKLVDLGIIEQECCVVQTWGRTIVVGEMRGTAKDLCQFAGTPQELLALVGGEGVRGGRGLGEGDCWMGHRQSRGDEKEVD